MNPSAYNERESRELGWKWALPALHRNYGLLGFEAALVAGIKGGEAPTIERGVRELQAALGLEVDGLLGPQTWAAYCRRNRAAVGTRPYLRIGGCRVPVALPVGVMVEHPAQDLFPHVGGLRETAGGIVLHWGGYDRASCEAALSERKLSSHLLVEGDLNPVGTLFVTQATDFAKVAWHVGSMNRWVIGVDICRSPSVRAQSRYPRAPIIENRTGRGSGPVLGLEPEYAAKVSAFLWCVAATLGIERHASPGVGEFTEAQKSAFKRRGGVVGHCNLSPPSERYDPAPWMDRLF